MKKSNTAKIVVIAAIAVITAVAIVVVRCLSKHDEAIEEE